MTDEESHKKLVVLEPREFVRKAVSEVVSVGRRATVVDLGLATVRDPRRGFVAVRWLLRVCVTVVVAVGGGVMVCVARVTDAVVVEVATRLRDNVRTVDAVRRVAV